MRPRGKDVRPCRRDRTFRSRTRRSSGARQSSSTAAAGTDRPIDARDLAALLEAAYGVTHALESDDGRRALPLRAVPSGGALYPLELYIAALRVDGLAPGLYHFDPLKPALGVARDSLTADAVASLSTYPEIVVGSAAIIFVAAVFGRTRFK